MTVVLEIRLFGGLEIRRGDAPIGGFVSSKAPALLAYLVVTGRSHQRDALATLLWGEMTDADAKNNLRQTLTNLRKLVEPHLVITRETIGWNTAVPHTLDTAQFENHLHRARGVAPPKSIAALQQAADWELPNPTEQQLFTAVTAVQSQANTLEAAAVLGQLQRETLSLR